MIPYADSALVDLFIRSDGSVDRLLERGTIIHGQLPEADSPGSDRASRSKQAEHRLAERSCDAGNGRRLGGRSADQATIDANPRATMPKPKTSTITALISGSFTVSANSCR
ncbi:MAG: hypothetical protein R2845_02390 [Thermomicrobiales bacterium]